MSYYMQGYRPVNPGTPQSYWSPIPGWQLNPFTAGPRVVAMSGCSGCGEVPDYNQTSYGVVYGVAAAALLVGTLAGYAAGKRPQKYKKNPKASHVVLGVAAVGAVAIGGVVLMKKKKGDAPPEGGGVPADGQREVSPALYVSNLTRTLLNPGGAPPPEVAPLPDARSGSGPAPSPSAPNPWGGSSWGGQSSFSV